MARVIITADVPDEVAGQLRGMDPDEALTLLPPWGAGLAVRVAPDSAVLTAAERMLPQYIAAERRDGEATSLVGVQYWLRVAADEARRLERLREQETS